MGNPLKRKHFRKLQSAQAEEVPQTVTLQKVEVKQEKDVQEKSVETIKEEIVQPLPDFKEEEKNTKKENKKK